MHIFPAVTVCAVNPLYKRLSKAMRSFYNVHVIVIFVRTSPFVVGPYTCIYIISKKNKRLSAVMTSLSPALETAPTLGIRVYVTMVNSIMVIVELVLCFML